MQRAQLQNESKTQPQMKRAQRAFDDAKTKAPLSSNKSESSEQDNRKIELLRGLRGYLFLNIQETLSKQGERLEKKDRKLYLQLLNAIFAEYLKCGNCGELGALAFFHLLENGIHENIELLNVCAFNEYGQEDGHTFVVLNRDEKQSDINKPETWENITLIDAWGRTSPVDFPKKTIRMSDIALVKGDISEIETLASFSRDLNTEEWQKMIDFLMLAKQVLETPDVMRFFKESAASYKLEPISFEQLHGIFDAKMNLYKNKIEELKNRIPSSPRMFSSQAKVEPAVLKCLTLHP